MKGLPLVFEWYGEILVGDASWTQRDQFVPGTGVSVGTVDECQVILQQIRHDLGSCNDYNVQSCGYRGSRILSPPVAGAGTVATAGITYRDIGIHLTVTTDTFFWPDTRSAACT